MVVPQNRCFLMENQKKSGWFGGIPILFITHKIPFLSNSTESQGLTGEILQVPEANPMNKSLQKAIQIPWKSLKTPLKFHQTAI